MEVSRLKVSIALGAVLAVAGLTGGCAVYSTPSGDVVGPAPVVVAPAPAVVISPFGYFGGYRHYGPRYYGRGYYGGPRYYGRPYYRY